MRVAATMMGDYSSEQIDWLRPPEVEGEKGDWTSWWLLVLRRMPEEDRVPPMDVHYDVLAARLTALGDGVARLELQTFRHPLDPEGYPAVDAVLRWVDAAFAIVEINNSAKGKWRTFR